MILNMPVSDKGFQTSEYLVWVYQNRDKGISTKGVLFSLFIAGTEKKKKYAITCGFIHMVSSMWLCRMWTYVQEGQQKKTSFCLKHPHASQAQPQF